MVNFFLRTGIKCYDLASRKSSSQFVSSIDWEIDSGDAQALSSAIKGMSIGNLSESSYYDDPTAMTGTVTTAVTDVNAQSESVYYVKIVDDAGELHTKKIVAANLVGVSTSDELPLTDTKAAALVTAIEGKLKFGAATASKVIRIEQDASKRKA